MLFRSSKLVDFLRSMSLQVTRLRVPAHPRWPAETARTGREFLAYNARTMGVFLALQTLSFLRRN
jgi:hypothetical protein